MNKEFMSHFFSFQTPTSWNKMSASKTYKHHHKKGFRKTDWDARISKNDSGNPYKNYMYCARYENRDQQVG